MTRASDPNHSPAALRARWPLPDADPLCQELVAAWAGQDRGHHGLQHLVEVLDHLERLRTAAATLEPRQWRALLLAAWFHDAVYDSAPEPEARSAGWARTALAGRDDVSSDEVVRLVMLTATHAPTEGDPAGQLLCDADLAILGASPSRYAEYVAGVRHEYASVPDVEFALGRAAILRTFLDRPHIFRTRSARALWEDTARANITAEITHLDGVAGRL